MNREQGMIKGVPFADYITDNLAVSPSLNAGTAATLIAECPRSAWYGHARLNPTGPGKHTKAMDNGTMCHAILLEGDMSKIAVIDPQDHPAEKTGNIPDGWTNKSIRAARDAARDAGKIPVLSDDFAGIQNMVDSANEFIRTSEIADIWPDTDREMTLLWQEDGMWFRGRPDALKKDRSIIIDVKTTNGSAYPDAWARSQMAGHNEIQMALGLRGLNALTGNENAKHIWLVIEQQAPHLCSLVAPDPAQVALGHAKLTQAARIWRECMTTGKWPGYPERICWVAPQPWEMARWEEMEAML